MMPAHVSPTRLAAWLCCLSAALVLAACSGDEPDPLAPRTNETYAESFERVWRTVDREYPYFVHKRIDWNAARTAFAPRAAQVASDSAFAAIIREMLGGLRDVHVGVTSPSGQYRAASTFPDRRNWSRDPWLSTLARADVPYRNSGDVGDAQFRVDGQVMGYLVVASLSGARVTTDALDAALERLRNTDALLIDVRMNGGGDSRLGLHLAGRLTAVRRAASSVQFRSGPLHTDLGSRTTGFTEPRGPFTISKPVTLLLGRGCVSSCEGLASAMEAIPTVRLVGDTTFGGSGNPGEYPLRGGWAMRVSRWIEYTTREVIIEDQGIAPAEVVRGDDAVRSAGRDAVLEAALRATLRRP
ncbi:MAG: S41 family peptidase [Gemmatimonadaceae bacterium]|jgi:hypothetical protein|nr:S41 family peptidase [Gemmatimonadaceae bacterium]